MISIYKKEISTYFNSFSGYFVIALFLFLTGLIVWVFPDTSVLSSGYATLDVFFDISPYLFMFLAPAVMMKSIAGEKMQGTYVLLLSKPLRISDIILSKFLAGLSVVFLTILPTLIYFISIYYLSYPLGNVDLGGMIGSYLGLLLLAACFIAISLFSSCLSNNIIVAFLLAVLFNFLIFYGIGAVNELINWEWYEGYIEKLGIDYHYRALSKGVLNAEDFFYFLSIIFLFLVLSIFYLQIRFNSKRSNFIFLFSSIVLILLINRSFFYRQFDRLDFTDDNRFTLKPATLNFISTIQEDIEVNILLDGDLPPGFKRLKEATLDMANDLRGISTFGRIKINLINPNTGSTSEQAKLREILISQGVYPTNLQIKSSTGYTEKLIYPYVIIKSKQREISVNLLQNRTGQSPEQILNNSIQNLEYAFVSAISKALSQEASFIAFTEGHGEASDLELYDAMHTLSASNQVGRLNLDSISFVDLKRIKVIVIAKPKERFSESDKYKIDYFVRHGGSVLWALDQIDISLQQLRDVDSQAIIGRNLNLDDQLFTYGVRLNYDLLADMNCAQIPVSVGNSTLGGQIKLLPWYFYPILMPTSNNPLIKNLDGIRTEFISTLDTVRSPDIHKEIILTSSPFNKVFKTGSSISLQMIEGASSPQDFKDITKPVAILLKGRFPYLYANRPAPAELSGDAIDLSSISKEAKMMVFADGDWLINQINTKDGSPYQLGWDRFTEMQFANRVFLENIMDYLMNEEELILLRNREVALRLLDQSLDKTTILRVQIINVGLPLLILLLGGGVQQYYRRKKYLFK